MQRSFLILATGFVALMAGALFYAARLPVQAPAQPEPATEVEAAPETAAAAVYPSFSLPDLNEKPRDFSEWRGKHTLLNFWATWCAPCLREMPLLETLHSESPGGLQVVGIAVDRPPAVDSFIAEAGVTYPILIGQQDAIAAAESFGPEFVALPFSILIAGDGAVIGLEAGELEAEELRGLAGLVAELAAGEVSVKTARERFPGG